MRSNVDFELIFVVGTGGVVRGLLKRPADFGKESGGGRDRRLNRLCNLDFRKFTIESLGIGERLDNRPRCGERRVDENEQDDNDDDTSIKSHGVRVSSVATHQITFCNV